MSVHKRTLMDWGFPRILYLAYYGIHFCLHLYLWPLSHDFVACQHFMKVTEKTSILEDPYLEFYNSVWPHLYTVGNLFQLAKTFQKTPTFENAQKYPKNEFLMCMRISLKETHVCTRVAIYNSRVCLKYVTFLHCNLRVLLVYATVVSATRASYASFVFYKSRMSVFAGCSCWNSRVIRGLSSFIVANRFLNI